MNLPLRITVGGAAVALLLGASPAVAETPHKNSQPSPIQHVLLISIDGMHAVDFANCAHGVPDTGNQPYCPNLAALSATGVNYLTALTSRPSDSFPGLTGLVTGATPRSTGAFYDVSYDRSLSPPAKTTPYGIVGGKDLCPSVIGTQIGFDEEIDNDLTRLDAGGGINANYLPRDPNNGCAPVYPHSFIRVNTLFNVVHNNGGYTAWSDKHQSYELTKGPTGDGVDDFYAPEINSIPINLPFAKYGVQGCNPLPDPGAATASNAWTDSFQNIQCYDKLKVLAVLNWIDGKKHDGTPGAPVPNVFGMNFQAVSVGQKLVEKALGLTGGYADAMGTPSASLLNEIQFVDKSIGEFVTELKNQGLYNSTLIIISAKHGQSPIDPNRVLRIPGDNASLEPPSQVLSPAGIGPGFPVVQALEDDVSLIWLADQTQTQAGVATLSANENLYGQGEIFAGPLLSLFFNDPLADPRTPDIIVAPNVGVIYTGGTKKVSEHGGFANDDRAVMLLVSSPRLRPSTVVDQVEVRQIAPTIIKALGLNPTQLNSVQLERTETLPGLPFTQP
jgi:Type I phosphodiesterase / nucleotide pyrophosphatase